MLPREVLKKMQAAREKVASDGLIDLGVVNDDYLILERRGDTYFMLLKSIESGHPPSGRTDSCSSYTGLVIMDSRAARLFWSIN